MQYVWWCCVYQEPDIAYYANYLNITLLLKYNTLALFALIFIFYYRTTSPYLRLEQSISNYTLIKIVGYIKPKRVWTC